VIKTANVPLTYEIILNPDLNVSSGAAQYKTITGGG
jgi:hypothetical protein